MAAPTPSPVAAGLSEESKLFGALCYIIGIIVPLFVLFTEKKKDKFLLFHAWQSLILTAVLIVLFIGFSFVTAAIAFVTMGLGSLLSCLAFPLMIVVGIYVLFVAYKAYQGVKYKIPMIGDYAEKQAMK